MKINIEELSKRDKERTAYHEAGHAVIALALNLKFVRAQITACDASDPMEETLWEGQCSYAGALPEHEPLLAFAGVIAESIHNGQWHEDWWQDLEIHELSPTDAAGIEKSLHWGDDSSQVHGILSEHWQKVERIADALIHGESLTDHMVLELWKIEPKAITKKKAAR